MSDKCTRFSKENLSTEAKIYLERFQSNVIVIKYGGSVMVEAELREQFAADIALLQSVGVRPVIVHGGGKEISRWVSLLGKETKFIEGLRVTDSDTMEITEMVLRGKVGGELASLINQCDGKAVSLSGKDADLFILERCYASTGEDLGQVGEVISTNLELLKLLSDADFIPVVSSVGRDKNGLTMNVNADHVAGKLASALGAIKLIYLTDVDGVLEDGELIPSLSLSETEELLKKMEGGMLPKLKCSVEALKEGVGRVHIINGTMPQAVLQELFTDRGIGTMISQKS